MSIRVALNHRTTYHYDRPIEISPHVVTASTGTALPHADSKLFAARAARTAIFELATGPERKLRRAVCVSGEIAGAGF